MKSTGFWTIGLLASILLLPGCESTFDYAFPDSTKLTIVAHPFPKGTWNRNPEVFIYSSLSPLDTNNFYTPSSIDVEITEIESEVSLKLDSIVEGDLVHWEIPRQFLKEGFNYSIKAFAPGFEPVSAKTRIPTPSKLTNLLVKDIKIEPSTKIEFKDIVHYKLEFSLEEFEQRPYYHLIFYNKYVGDSLLYYIEPELNANVKFSYNYDVGILIDGAHIEDGIPLIFNFVDWTVGEEVLERVYVELRTVTEDYFKYNSTLSQQVLALIDPFHVPITIYNNIEGGFGNFGGYSPNIGSFEVPH